jgi:hypothetical protein
VKRIRPDDPSQQRSWTNKEAPAKYEKLTMGDRREQDNEAHLITQDDAHETVEPHAPELRTRGRSPHAAKGDTRENADFRLDDPSAEPGTDVPPPRTTRKKKRNKRS